MELFLFFVLILLLLGLFAARLIAIVLHVFGVNLPFWLLWPLSEDTPRFVSGSISIAMIYFFAALFFQLPFFDLFDLDWSDPQ